MGRCREIPVACGLEGILGGPQQPQRPLPPRRAVHRRAGMCHELVHAHAHQERQRAHARGRQQQRPGAFHSHEKVPFPKSGAGGADSGKDFLISRSPKKPGGEQKEGLGWGGDWELWQEPRKPEPSLCPSAPAARFQVNINGFLQRQQDNTLHFTVGNEVRGPDSRETW